MSGSTDKAEDRAAETVGDLIGGDDVGQRDEAGRTTRSVAERIGAAKARGDDGVDHTRDRIG
jgi:hypothetical protein